MLLDHPGRLLVSVADGDCDPSDPASKFLLRQKAQMAEYELDQIKARVRRWHRQRAEHGWPLVSGRRPFGWVDSQRSAVEPVEAAVIEYVPGPTPSPPRRTASRGARRTCAPR